MDDITNEEKILIKDGILKNVDKVNIVLGTPNYVKKYTDTEIVDVQYDNDGLKRFMVSSRERLRKISTVSWYTDKFTATEIQDITNTLSIVRQKISDLFT
jgi:hypothetical protein